MQTTTVAGTDVTEGFAADLRYFRIGDGPPVVVLPGLGPTNEPPTGFARRIEISYLKPLAKHATVYSIYRRVGLREHVTVKDIAEDCVAAIGALFNEPVDIVGISTGGNSALQIALDYPEILRRLVLLSAGSELSESSRIACERACKLAEAGHVRASQRAITPAAFEPGILCTIVGWIAWLVSPLALPRDWNPSDMVRTMRADNAFNVTARLPEITAPTLIVNGRSDPSFTPEISKATADGIPDATLKLYKGSHGGVLLNKHVWEDVVGFIRP